MHRKFPVMLFAAGRGTRMAPLTDDLPKPMVEVAGRPLVAHALSLLDADMLGPVVANICYLPELIEPYLRDRGVQTIRESSLLDTGGGLKNALPLLGQDPVLTLNADSVWSGDDPVTQLLAAWDADVMDALLLLVARDRALGHTGAGDFDADSDGRLSRGTRYVYTGMQILKTDRLSGVGDRVFSLNRLWDMMARDARLFGVQYRGSWCDVGRPESIPLAEAMLRGGQ